MFCVIALQIKMLQRDNEHSWVVDAAMLEVNCMKRVQIQVSLTRGLEKEKLNSGTKTNRRIIMQMALKF